VALELCEYSPVVRRSLGILCERNIDAVIKFALHQGGCNCLHCLIEIRQGLVAVSRQLDAKLALLFGQGVKVEALSHLNNRSRSGPHESSDIRLILNCDIYDVAILVDMEQYVVHLLRTLPMALQLFFHILNVFCCRHSRVR